MNYFAECYAIQIKIHIKFKGKENKFEDARNRNRK